MRIACLSVLALVGIVVSGCVEPDAPQPFASNAGAERCAGQLSPKASAIYQDIAPHMMPDTNLEALMRQRVMRMIVTGDLSMRAARPAAEKAAECLEMLQH